MTATTRTTPGRSASARAARGVAPDASAARVIGARRPPGRRDPRGPGTASAPRRPHVLPPHDLFAERLLAVLSGGRPVHWMLGWTVGEAYEQLVQLAPGAPLGAAAGRPRPVIRRCRGFRPRPGVVEAYASIVSGARVRAMAFRLEQGEDRRWRCAAVEIGGARVTRQDA
ncbi:Rv3235 family protein [Streptomyces sp. DW26H14]|uniref:Rv3235 family protein n=1 Tax=Streptomyces sp. DW26H14 TaxID=3435395 RepID=UPI00403D7CD5